MVCGCLSNRSSTTKHRLQENVIDEKKSWSRMSTVLLINVDISSLSVILLTDIGELSHPTLNNLLFDMKSSWSFFIITEENFH